MQEEQQSKKHTENVVYLKSTKIIYLSLFKKDLPSLFLPMHCVPLPFRF